MKQLALLAVFCLLADVSIAAPDFTKTKASADQGDANSQHSLGIMYDLGDGVQQDRAEAVRWYRKAAEQGYAPAQYNRGVKYRKGDGLPQDYTEADKWYLEAANQGCASAQCNLGVMYTKGNGVPRNYTEAFVWSGIAEVSGHEDARHNREFVTGMLSPEELTDARERTEKLLEDIRQRKAP